MRDYISQLKPDHTYHVYNRSIGSEKLFHNDENYRYFLQEYQKYIIPICHTFCYSLLPNHFHFLIRCKEEKEITKLFIENCKNATTLSEFENSNGVDKEKILSNYISHQYSRLFNGYTQALNIQKGRHGSLFSRPFKRIEVSEEIYLRKLVQYIHYNPVEAKLCKMPCEWAWSSYNVLLLEDATFLKREEIIQWFENKSNFISIHGSNFI